jgi:hypothetical protein
MTATIRLPVLQWGQDEDGIPFTIDETDLHRFLDDVVEGLIVALDGRFDPYVRQDVASLLEARAAKLKPKRGRPKGSRNSHSKFNTEALTKRHRRRLRRSARKRAEELDELLAALIDPDE